MEEIKEVIDKRSWSNFDKLAETTKGKRIETDPKVRYQITNEFLTEYNQGIGTQSKAIEKLIEKYPDIDLCEILRPWADLNRE